MLPGTLAAQEVIDFGGSMLLNSNNSCLDSIPPTTLTRVVVYAQAHLDDSAARSFLPSADVFTQAIAERARVLLGARGDTLPRAEPTIVWRQAGASLKLTAYRDGRIAWHVPADRPDTAAAALLAQAASALYDDGYRMFWPEDLAADSVSFRIILEWPAVRRDGNVEPPSLRTAMPVFSMAVPWTEGVKPVRQARPSYPQELERAGFGANLLLLFIVDTAGRAVESSIRDYWPAKKPPLEGEMRRHYLTFVEASRKAAARSRYQPGRIGGCAVYQLVQAPYVYKFPGQPH